MACYFGMDITLTGSATIDPVTNNIKIGPTQGGFILNTPIDMLTQFQIQQIEWNLKGGEKLEYYIGGILVADNTLVFPPSPVCGVGLPTWTDEIFDVLPGNMLDITESNCNPGSFPIGTFPFNPGDLLELRFSNTANDLDVEHTYIAFKDFVLACCPGPCATCEVCAISGLCEPLSCPAGESCNPVSGVCEPVPSTMVAGGGVFLAGLLLTTGIIFLIASRDKREKDVPKVPVGA